MYILLMLLNDVTSTMRTQTLMVDVHMGCDGYKEQKIIAPNEIYLAICLFTENRHLPKSFVSWKVLIKAGYGISCDP